MVSRLRQAIATGGLAAILALSSGCLGENIAGALIEVRGVQRGYAPGIAVGRALQSDASARAGRSEINVQVNNSPPGRTIHRGSGTRYYKGKLTDGSDYEGGMKNNRPEGTGSRVYPDGVKYIGEFKNGDSYGRGELSSSKDGRVERYIGEFREGRIEGQGEYTFFDGRTYKGKFRNNLFERGIATTPEGRVFEGELKVGNNNNQDLWNGKSIETLPNGSKIEHTVKDGIVVDAPAASEPATTPKPSPKATPK